MGLLGMISLNAFPALYELFRRSEFVVSAMVCTVFFCGSLTFWCGELCTCQRFSSQWNISHPLVAQKIHNTAVSAIFRSMLDPVLGTIGDFGTLIVHTWPLGGCFVLLHSVRYFFNIITAFHNFLSPKIVYLWLQDKLHYLWFVD